MRIKALSGKHVCLSEYLYRMETKKLSEIQINLPAYEQAGLSALKRVAKCSLLDIKAAKRRENLNESPRKNCCYIARHHFVAIME